jgi:hypothetical protein
LTSRSLRSLVSTTLRSLICQPTSQGGGAPWERLMLVCLPVCCLLPASLTRAVAAPNAPPGQWGVRRKLKWHCSRECEWGQRADEGGGRRTPHIRWATRAALTWVQRRSKHVLQRGLLPRSVLRVVRELVEVVPGSILISRCRAADISIRRIAASAAATRMWPADVSVADVSTARPAASSGSVDKAERAGEPIFE